MSFFTELRRRKVIETTLAYVLAAGVLTHVAEQLVRHGYVIPMVSEVCLILGIVALPLVVGLAWIFDITARGVEITGSDASKSRVAVSWKQVALPVTASLLLLIIILAFISLNAAQ